MSESILLQGDSLEILKDLPDNSVTSVVTDPPYGLSFMGNKWDYDVPSAELWREVLRVLKPGGHLLSFGGTRTYHRMVVNIEDAGFEIRDQIQWLYGSGFPKSHNIEKATGDPKYAGLGTALKPANEPICLARKPLESKLTIAENVVKYGTGGLNIDATRIEGKLDGDPNRFKKTDGGEFVAKFDSAPVVRAEGRFPANIILDEEAAAALDGQSGQLKNGGQNATSKKGDGMFMDGSTFKGTSLFAGDKGGASRFFYCAKASKSERGEGNVHPTVKPVKLMEYLVKLITPVGGVVLDPFMGSGTTGVACKNLGFTFIGVELDPDYIEIADKRINNIKVLTNTVRVD